MKCKLLALAIMTMATSLANADFINNLQISVLQDAVPQSLSNPCVICPSTAPGQPANFGYHNFVSQGNDTSFDTFSTNILGGGALLDNLEANALPYSGQLLQAFLNAGGNNTAFTFGIVVDINTASGGETLEKFQLINLDNDPGERIIFDFTGPLALPDIRNGAGFGDYLITGFSLADAGVELGDRLLFRAAWSGATDGGEQFYLTIIPSDTPDEVPEPGSLALMGTGLLGLGMIARRRRNDDIYMDDIA